MVYLLCFSLSKSHHANSGMKLQMILICHVLIDVLPFINVNVCDLSYKIAREFAKRQCTCMPVPNTALNDALKKEVERLKVATGETMTHTDSYNLGMDHLSYPPSSLFSHQLQTQPGDLQNIQMPQFLQFQSNMSRPHQPLLAAVQSHAFTDMLQQDPIGRLQGLDISGRGSHMVKPEGMASISVSESSNRF